MKVKQAIRKIVALGTGITMVGATLFGATAADLAEYPEPLFIQNGVFNGIIVVGDSAAASDVVGSVDIATALQFSSKIEQKIEGAVGTTQLMGDVVKIGDASDLLEINEPIGDVKETITEFDLEALRGGIISTDEGTTDYNQYLRFSDTDVVTGFNSSGVVVFEQDEDDEVGDFLRFNENEPVFEYELEFEEGLESTVINNELDDIEDEIITLLGEEFSIVDTDIDMAAHELTVELIGGAILDTLEEGETKTYTFNGKEYEVNVLIVCDTCGNEGTVKFRINGFVTDQLGDGDTDILSDGTEIGIREIMPNEAEEISGGDLVEFYLGANEIELTDKEYIDDNFEAGVEINSENIEDADVMIKATNKSDTKVSIDTIKYRLEADSPKGNVYIKPGQGLREYLDEPEGMLNPNWDIRYEGLTDTGVSIIKFDAKGDDSYDLRFTNKEGIDYNIPWVDNSNDEGFGFNFGDDDNKLVWVEPRVTTPAANGNHYNIREGDYFVVTDDNDETAITRILSYESVDYDNGILTFTDEGVGNREITFTKNGTGHGRGKLVVGGNTFLVNVNNNTYATGKYNISIDLNNDGVIGAAWPAVDVAYIVVQGGGIIIPAVNSTDLTGTQGVGGNWSYIIDDWADDNLTAGQDSFFTVLKTLNSEFDENGPNGITGDENIFINITQANTNEVDLAVYEQWTLNEAGGNLTIDMQPLDEVDLSQGLSPYGVFLEQTDDNEDNDADELTIEYPLVQRGADVFVVYGSVSSSGKSSGGVYNLVTPIDVGAAKLASEVSGVSNYNAIVVGGPCANAVAADLMGNPEQCWEAIPENKAIIKLYEHSNGNVALLVAGRTALDTRRACRVLAKPEMYDVAGKELQVTGTSLSDISVSAVA